MDHALRASRNPHIFDVCHKSESSIFRSDGMARLLLDVLRESREAGRLLVHEFVIMPDHFHFIITPAEHVSLEKAAQYIKGGFSFRAKRELNYRSLMWEESFTNHRIRDEEDYAHRDYIHENPVEAQLVKGRPTCTPPRFLELPSTQYHRG